MTKVSKKIKEAVDGMDFQHGLALLPKGRLVYKRSCKGKQLYTDVSDTAYAYLFERVYVHSDFTVKDLFLLLEKNSKVFSLIFMKEYFSEVMRYFKKIKEGRKKKEFDRDFYIEAVELYWFISSLQGEDPNDRKLREAIEGKRDEALKNKDSFLSNLFESRKKEIGKDLKCGSYWKKVEDSKYIYGLDFPDCHILGRDKEEDEVKPYSMSFIPLEQLLNVRLSLSKKLDLVVEEDTEGKFIEHRNPDYTLGQVIQGFLWEFSWHGTPEETKKRGENIFSIGKELKNIKF